MKIRLNESKLNENICEFRYILKKVIVNYRYTYGGLCSCEPLKVIKSTSKIFGNLSINTKNNLLKGIMKKLFDKKVITCLVILCVTGIFFYVRNKNNLSEIDTNNTDLLYHGWDVGDVINHTYIYSNGKVVESSNLKENRIIKRLSKKQINRLRELIDKCEIKI